MMKPVPHPISSNRPPNSARSPWRRARTVALFSARKCGSRSLYSAAIRECTRILASRTSMSGPFQIHRLVDHIAGSREHFLADSEYVEAEHTQRQHDRASKEGDQQDDHRQSLREASSAEQR